jgi:hypothetical protein
VIFTVAALATATIMVHSPKRQPATMMPARNDVVVRSRELFARRIDREIAKCDISSTDVDPLGTHALSADRDARSRRIATLGT